MIVKPSQSSRLSKHEIKYNAKIATKTLFIKLSFLKEIGNKPPNRNNNQMTIIIVNITLHLIQEDKPGSNHDLSCIGELPYIHTGSLY